MSEVSRSALAFALPDQVGAVDVFDIQALFPELVMALGAALVGGNALALWHESRGRRPAEAPPLRKGRAWFLLTVGLIMTAWGLATLIT